MKVLLDTHAFLWFIMGDSRLSTPARSAIESDTNTKYVSAASAWEIAIKSSLGKLPLREPYEILIPREIQRNGFIYLPIELSHTSRVATFPLHHRDPFDRLLAAQAYVEGMGLISIDNVLDAYGISRIW